MGEINCKKCKSKHTIKSGFMKGHQRYRCKDCRYQFTNTPPRGVPVAMRKLAVVLYGLCGVSMLKISKLFGVSVVAVLKWIRAEAATIADVTAKTESGVVMIDEIWHFVSGKKTKFGSGERLTGSRVECWGGYVVIAPMLQQKS